MQQNTNVVRLAPRESILKPDAVLYIINAGDANGRGLGLSELGEKQAERLGNHVRDLGLRFDLVICPNDPVTAQTASKVLAHHGKPLWPQFSGCEFISPRNEATTRALRDLVELAKANRSIHLVPKGRPATLYSLCNYQLRNAQDSFLEGFRDEIRKDARALSGVREASRIALFSREVVGNIIAEALFPKHRNEIENIELYPCSVIRLSAISCQQFPLLY